MLLGKYNRVCVCVCHLVGNNGEQTYKLVTSRVLLCWSTIPRPLLHPVWILLLNGPLQFASVSEENAHGLCVCVGERELLLYLRTISEGYERPDTLRCLSRAKLERRKTTRS